MYLIPNYVVGYQSCHSSYAANTHEESEYIEAEEMSSLSDNVLVTVVYAEDNQT